MWRCGSTGPRNDLLVVADGCVDRGGPVVLVGTEMIALILLTVCSVAVIVSMVVLYAWFLTLVIK